MVSVYLPSDALSQHLPSYLGFSDFGYGIALHSFPSKVKPLLLTLDEFTSPDLECGVAPLGPPAPAQPLLLGTVFQKKKKKKEEEEERKNHLLI